MRTTIAAFLFLLIAPVSGCARSVDEAPATGSSDCQQGVRLKGVTYIEVGYLDRVDKVGDKAGEAALGECDDMGSDPAGLNFPYDARTVEVWTVPGADPDEAVARKTSDGLQLFVADSLEEDERTQVVADLGLEG